MGVSQDKVDQYHKDIEDARGYITISNNELKKVQEEAEKATPAPETDEEGMTTTPAIPRDWAEKIKKAADDLGNWKGHYRTLITKF